jgi:putative hydrolase of the HAD superfamily
LVRINAVIFDLDNVLFCEQDYINAAYRNIAVFLSKSYRLSEEQVYQKLLKDLQKKTSMCSHLFDDFLIDFGLDKRIVSDILWIYANTTLNLGLYPDAEHLLSTLKKQKIKLGLVTNGNAETQRNKVRLLNIEKYFDTIVYALELGKENEKPNPKAYRLTLQALRSKPEETICIGDNPYTDFYGAKKLGIRTVRLRNGEFRDVRLSEEYEADLMVRNLKEFSNIIAQNNQRLG